MLYAASRAVLQLHKVVEMKEPLCSVSERGDLIKTDKFSWVQQSSSLVTALIRL